ncbi:hypothetical protein ACE6H2_026048 [Prunus campanulata]
MNLVGDHKLLGPIRNKEKKDRPMLSVGGGGNIRLVASRICVGFLANKNKSLSILLFDDLRLQNDYRTSEMACMCLLALLLARVILADINRIVINGIAFINEMACE